MISVVTDHPLATDIVDHIYPDGIFYDNRTNGAYIQNIENYFGGRPLNVLDLGCAGGQLIVDLHKRGHKAVGLEGSDFALKTGMHNWPEYYQKVLFNCDLRYPFSIMEDGEQMKFDFVTSWEVLEHIPPEYLSTFFKNVHNHMKPDGIFVGSVATGQNSRWLIQGETPPSAETPQEGGFYIDTNAMLVYGPKNGGQWGEGRPIKAEEIVQTPMIDYHGVYPAAWWEEKFLEFFIRETYPFPNIFRDGIRSVIFMLKPKHIVSNL